MKLTKMKLLVTLAACGLLACSTALGQDQSTTGNAQQQGGSATGQLKSRVPSIDTVETSLGLTDDQKTKVTPILTQEREQMRSIYNDTSLSRDDKIAKVKSIRSDTATQMKSILTPDQYEKWQTMMSRGLRRPTTPGGGGTTTPSAPPTTPATPPATGP